MLLLAVNVALVICSPLNVLSMNTQRRQSSHIAHVKTHCYRYIYIYIYSIKLPRRSLWCIVRRNTRLFSHVVLFLFSFIIRHISGSQFTK